MSSVISVLHPSKIEDISFYETIPDRPAVFALNLRAPNGEVPPPFLGRTQNLRRRLLRLLRPSGTVSRLLSLGELTTEIEYQLVGSQLEALVQFYNLNRRHYPRNYRQRLRLKSPVLLKVNLRNRFPRCYLARRISNDGSLYYGPFPSRPVAERFASDFLDLFKIRRCVEDLDPDPAHPGCIYSQMKMCLAPCFRGCTDKEYQQEVARVAASLDTSPCGEELVRSLEAERATASESSNSSRPRACTVASKRFRKSPGRSPASCGALPGSTPSSSSAARRRRASSFSEFTAGNCAAPPPFRSMKTWNHPSRSTSSCTSCSTRWARPRPCRARRRGST